ncbi:hypothetical protein DFJ73DRAFT_661230 [Zopfochytrium polystomum]|nr:hypothetical protein DFJ73DRAFT_661230 [Zopfochytrium polystomum]
MSKFRFVRGLLDDPARPVFPTSARNIAIIDTPSDFHDRIVSGIRTAKHRIVLSSLYLGTEDTSVVDALRETLRKTSLSGGGDCDGPRVHILIDYLRGTRQSATGASSATVLADLAREFPGRVRVSLYRLPTRNPVWRIMPPRFNEAAGLMHMKAYAFDDSLIMSGANLSKDYFTNRQDRYILFSQSPELVTYYEQLAETLGSHSTTINSKTGDLELRSPSRKDIANSVKSFTAEWAERSRRQTAATASEPSQSTTASPSSSTFVIPLIQAGSLGIREEEDFLQNFMNAIAPHPSVKVVLSSAYLNFPKHYIAGILRSKAQFSLVTASPKANGFYGSKGVSRHIPSVYTFIEKKLWKALGQTGRRESVDIFEYCRPDWTYHVKGLWYAVSGHPPEMTIIGSSNFGQRSLRRDFESQLILVTSDNDLRERLRKDIENVTKYCEKVNDSTFAHSERRVHPLVALGTRLLKHLF